MPTFYWNLDTNQVSLLPYDQSEAGYAAAQGSTPIRLICQRGDVNNPSTVFLASGSSAGIVIRDPANLKIAAAAGPVMLTKGATPADGYIGAISTDSSYVRDLMHADPADPLPETALYELSAVFFALPMVGDDTESTPFAWTVLPKYYLTGTPPADIVAVWSSPAQLEAAIAQAAAAIKTGDDALLNSLDADFLVFGDLVVSYDSTIRGNSQSIEGDPDLQPWSLLVLNGDSCGRFLAIPVGQSVRRTADGTGFETYTPNTGNGAALTNLNASNLASGTVAIARGGTGAASAGDALTALGGAPLASPTFTGLVTIPAGASIEGFALLASPTFTGTVTIPAGAAIAGYVTSVDGRTPNSSGAVTLLSDQAAGTASLRTLGTGSAQAAAGNDTRFPASVTGVRVGAGAGSTDTAAVPGTSIAPFHPVSYNTGSASGTTLTYASGVSHYTAAGADQYTDVSGILQCSVTTGGSAGVIHVATITFNASQTYNGIANGPNTPKRAQVTGTGIFNSGTGVFYGVPSVDMPPTLGYVLTATTLDIYLYSANTGAPAAVVLAINYFIPPA